MLSRCFLLLLLLLLVISLLLPLLKQPLLLPCPLLCYSEPPQLVNDLLQSGNGGNVKGGNAVVGETSGHAAASTQVMKGRCQWGDAMFLDNCTRDAGSIKRGG